MTLVLLRPDDECCILCELIDVVVVVSRSIRDAVEIFEELENAIVKGELGRLERVRMGHFV